MSELLDFIKACDYPPRDNHESTIDYLSRIRSDYSNTLNTFAASSDPVVRQIINARPQMEALFDGILKAIDKYLEGYPHDAQNIFDAGLSAAEPWLKSLILQPTSPGGVGWLFRMRVFEDLSSKERGELFHIPFELRYNIKAQRFSIPGIPCLYAGSTSYVCWEELNRPILEKTVIMGLKIAKPLPVLSIAITHKHILNAVTSWGGNLFNAYLDQTISYFVCLPLFISVSIPTAHPGANFIEEYIIPQLLLRWVREHPDCVGVRYFSTHIDPNTASHLASNFVFPTKTNRTSGHCASLASYFQCTEPVSWSLFHSLGLPISGTSGGEIFLTKERPVQYILTTFGRIDGSIIHAPVAAL